MKTIQRKFQKQRLELHLDSSSISSVLSECMTSFLSHFPNFSLKSEKIKLRKVTESPRRNIKATPLGSAGPSGNVFGGTQGAGQTGQWAGKGRTH